MWLDNSVKGMVAFIRTIITLWNPKS